MTVFKAETFTCVVRWVTGDGFRRILDSWTPGVKESRGLETLESLAKMDQSVVGAQDDWVLDVTTHQVAKLGRVGARHRGGELMSVRL
eukprot:CAMPEP_0198351856 /NCGR_PEP_ID=MMETSP1450-20131203/104564_1 /TAXON_ID=753684 ORGANISM="Madagascaria erythrocladiodes, Strain CCMP3234" /NCGR_SAMPLE_ID=MMETSP1450 /ASSEMBLY_ACC=CAM_ASM_001115 /LENGTH=87 /DNA_ID=CAMNT_0044057819 /DNA_START=142 /DNA_END=406 /DNA_ORIENTATION=+